MRGGPAKAEEGRRTFGGEEGLMQSGAPVRRSDAPFENLARLDFSTVRPPALGVSALLQITRRSRKTTHSFSSFRSITMFPSIWIPP